MSPLLPRSIVVIVLARGLIPSAAVAQPTPTSATALHGCTVSGCGSNTPVLFGTPIIGLSLDGKANDVGVVLDDKLERSSPERSSPRPCPGVPDRELARLRLRVLGGEFKGMSGNVVRCEGDAMLGMVFAIHVPVTCNKKPGCRADAVRVRVKIDQRGSIWTWDTRNRQSVPTYRLVWYELPNKWPGPGIAEAHVGSSVCPDREAWMESWQQAKDPVAGPAWHDQTDHLIPVQGETYTPEASIDARRTGKDWFDLACVGTAIAKMRLLGYDPMVRQQSEAAERQATLKMLTARYRGSRSYTSAGMPLMWKHRDIQRTFEGTPEAGTWHPDVVESYWDAEGAKCLQHRRTWTRLDRPGSPITSVGGNTLLRVSDLLNATMRHAMPEVDPPPRPPLPAACRQWDVVTSRCSGPLETAYAGYEQTIVTAVGDIPCPSSPDYVWVTYPVNHVAHAAH